MYQLLPDALLQNMTPNDSARDGSLSAAEGSSDSRPVELTFRRGDASADELQAVVDEVLAELAVPGSEADSNARDVGLEPGNLGPAAVTVREGEQGADPFTVSIIVSIAVSAGSVVAKSIWTDVIWPRIKRRLGVRALEEPDGEGK